MSEAPVVENKTTLGESLFLVHLSRQTEVSAEDFDHEAKHQRERGASVGEELWHVHCKRAAGNLDQDYEDDEVPISAPEETTRAKDKPETPPKKSRSTDNSGEDEIKVIHHLRNRDIKIP
jgi:hypothetical protein